MTLKTSIIWNGEAMSIINARGLQHTYQMMVDDTISQISALKKSKKRGDSRRISALSEKLTSRTQLLGAVTKLINEAQ